VTGWESFEPALTKAEEADIIDIWRCAEVAPPEWYEYDRDGLNRIVESVHQRRSMIRDLITHFATAAAAHFRTGRRIRHFIQLLSSWKSRVWLRIGPRDSFALNANRSVSVQF
jgi:hypothetical protein